MSSAPKPRRRATRAAYVMSAVCPLLFLAAVVPGSPVHVSEWLRPGPNHEGRSVGRLASDLANPDPEARKQAAIALGRLNADAAEAIPRLAELLRTDPDPSVRAAAGDAIAKMTPASRIVVNELAAALADRDPLVRLNAAMALLRLKGEARPAVPALIAAAQDEDNDTNLGMVHVTVRQVALRALGHAAAGTDAAVPVLAAALDRPAPTQSRMIVAEGLGLAGPHARGHAPALRSLLTDPEPEVREAAAEAIGRIGETRSGPVRAAEFADLSLPEPERVRLWELEHRGNVLNKYGFDPLAAALARSDATALGRLLAPGFVGSEPADPTRVRSAGFADVERVQDAGRPPAPVGGPGFVARLLDLRSRCGPAAAVKLVVATLRPVNPADPAGLWAGRALLRIHGEAGGAPVEVTAALDYEVAGPTESGLAAGGWLRAAHIRQLAVARSPRYLFAETGKARGLDTAALHDNWAAKSFTAMTGGVYVTDFDRDGYLDLLVTDLNVTALYRGGPGGRFTDVTAARGLPRGGAANTLAAWVDLDGDGWDDLILGQRVYRNEGGGRFVDYTARCDLRLPANPTSLLVADYDRDGRLDLYVTRAGAPGKQSWLEGRTDDAQGNVLLRNLGGWRFEDVTKRTGTRGGYRSSFTAAWLDANDDGWPDLYVPNEFGDGVLLVNRGDGTFRSAPLADRPADFGTMGLAVGDIDNDGRIDIYCANMYSKAGTRVIGNLTSGAYPPPVMERLRRLVAGSQLHLNRGGLRFDQVGPAKQLAAVGWAYGPTLADLDSDGLLDVYATAGFSSRDRTEPDG